jgi:hypothetical protein
VRERITRGLARSLGRAAAQEKPFMACFALPQQGSARTLEAGAFPGLVAAHSAVHGDTAQLVSYWTTREDYDRYGKELYETVGATARIAEHYVTHYHEPRTPLWKRIPWYTMLMTALAVVGAVSTFRSEIEKLRLAPEVGILPRSEARNYLVGDPIDEPLSVTNQRPVTGHVAVVRPEVASKGVHQPYRVDVSPNPFSLPENRTEIVHFQAAVSTPGKYVLRGRLHVSAGRFAEPIERPIAIPFRVWSAKPTLEERKLKIEKQDKTNSRMTGVLLLGRAAENGVRCTVLIRRHPELFSVFTTFPGHETLQPWKVEGPKGGELGKVIFHLPDVSPMRAHMFPLELASKVETDWEGVVRDMDEVECKPCSENDCKPCSKEGSPCDGSSST